MRILRRRHKRRLALLMFFIFVLLGVTSLSLYFAFRDTARTFDVMDGKKQLSLPGIGEIPWMNETIHSDSWIIGKLLNQNEYFLYMLMAFGVLALGSLVVYFRNY